MIENPTPKAITIWLTGLSGSGKTTLANALGEKLKEKNINYLCIDGEVFRCGSEGKYAARFLSCKNDERSRSNSNCFVNIAF